MQLGAIALAVSAGLMSVAVQASCPSEFSVFLRQFQDDELFRLAHVRFPVDLRYVDAAAVPEPQPRRRHVGRKDVVGLRLLSPPTTSMEASRQLERDIRAVARGGRVVRFTSPDSDAYVAEFWFARGKACWQLVRVIDTSL